MYSIIKGKSIILSLILILLVFTGCSKVGSKYSDDSEVVSSNEKLAIIESFPDNKIMDEFIPINSLITINFNNILNARTICYSNIYLTNEVIDSKTQKSVVQKIPCSPIIINDKEITFKPMQRLVANEIYTISVTEYVKDENNSSFESLLSWSFMAKDIGRLRVKKESEILKNGELTYDFGDMFKDASTGNISFDLENFGTKSVAITSITLTGDDTQFTLSDAGITSIDSESSHKINVKFNPTAEGGKNAAIEIAYTDGIGADVFIINLTGEGLPIPDFQVGYLTDPLDPGTFITLMPGAGEYDFGTVLLQKNSGEKTFAIKNTRSAGDAILISGVNIENSDFVLDTSGMSNSIEADTLTTFKVTYVPTDVTTDESDILNVLSSDVEGGVYPITLKGNCTNPEIEVKYISEISSNGEFNFNDYATQYEGVESLEYDLTITNKGTGLLTLDAIDPIVITGDTAYFNIDYSAITAGMTIDAGNSVIIKIKYLPGVETEKNLLLTIKSNDLDEPEYNINLKGTALDLLSLSFNSSNVEIKQGSSANFELTGHYAGEFTKRMNDYASWTVTNNISVGMCTVVDGIVSISDVLDENKIGSETVTAGMATMDSPVDDVSKNFDVYYHGVLTLIFEDFQSGWPAGWSNQGSYNWGMNGNEAQSYFFGENGRTGVLESAEYSIDTGVIYESLIIDIDIRQYHGSELSDMPSWFAMKYWDGSDWVNFSPPSGMAVTSGNWWRKEDTCSSCPWYHQTFIIPTPLSGDQKLKFQFWHEDREGGFMGWSDSGPNYIDNVNVHGIGTVRP